MSRDQIFSFMIKNAPIQEIQKKILELIFYDGYFLQLACALKRFFFFLIQKTETT